MKAVHNNNIIFFSRRPLLGFMGVDSDISRAEGPFSWGIIRDYTYLEQIDKEPAAFQGTVMDDISSGGWRDLDYNERYQYFCQLTL